MASTTANSSTKSSANSPSPLTEKTTEALHKAVDTLADKAAGKEEKLRDSATHSAEAITKQQKELQDKWQNSKVRSYASENPVAAAGIAFAAGVLVSTLLRRS